MNKFSLIFIFLFTSLSIGSKSDVYAGNSKNNDTPLYKKLFKDKSKLHTEKGMMTIHRYEDKLYFEMPTALLGRDFLMQSVATRSSHLEFVGVEGAPQRYITIERTDSLILYKEFKGGISSREDDEQQSQAMEQSKGAAIFYTFPIKGYTCDSLSVIYDVSSFYKPTNKDIFDLKGKAYNSPFISISAFSTNAGSSFLNEVHAYDSSVMVVNTVSAALSLNLLGLIPLFMKPEVSIEFATYLVLLNQQQMPIRMANQNVGTGIVRFYDYKPLVSTKWEQYATRRRIEKGQEIIFYADTLLPSEWLKAVTEASEEWNKVFESEGLGKPLRILPFPKDAHFSSHDPQYNIISFTPMGRGLYVNNIVDPRTGEILSSRMNMGQDIADRIRMLGILQLSAVDERFRTYFTPNDAIYEGIRGLALPAFGRTLGLVTNYAGSYAYTPEQIRSADFTRVNGFTASVMDNILYNMLAQPGDKEKGVKLVTDRLGVADAFAIRYLYKDFGSKENETEALKKLVRSHEKDPRFLYIGRPSTLPSDPRGQADDLGNNPFVYLQNRTNNLKILVNNAPKWFIGDDIPQVFTRKIPEAVVEEYYSVVIPSLYHYIGGFYINEANQNSALPPYSAVDKKVQKKVVKTLFEAYDDIEWLDNNRAFLYMGGMNTNVTAFVRNRGLPMLSFVQQLKPLSFYAQKTKKPYTPAEYISDIESYLFKEVIQGRPLSINKELLVDFYITTLIALSPTLTEIGKASKKAAKTALTDEIFMPLSQTSIDELEWEERMSISKEQMLHKVPRISYLNLPDLTPLIFQALGRTERLLEKSKSESRDEMYKRRMDFHLRLIKKILYPERS